MGTTSPDSIYYADDSTAYDVPAVMAAMANSVQAALTNGTDWSYSTTPPSGVTVGNGTLVQRYRRVNGMVYVQGSLIFGSTTSLTGSSGVIVTHPGGISATSVEGYQYASLGQVSILDAGNTWYFGRVLAQTPTTAFIIFDQVTGTATEFGLISSVTPVPLAAGSILTWTYAVSVV